MKTIKELQKLFNGRVFVVVDAQEWEAVEGVDFQTWDDVVDYEVLEDLEFNDYALIKKAV